MMKYIPPSEPTPKKQIEEKKIMNWKVQNAMRALCRDIPERKPMTEKELERELLLTLKGGKYKGLPGYLREKYGGLSEITDPVRARREILALHPEITPERISRYFRNAGYKATSLNRHVLAYLRLAEGIDIDWIKIRDINAYEKAEKEFIELMEKYRYPLLTVCFAIYLIMKIINRDGYTVTSEENEFFLICDSGYKKKKYDIINYGLIKMKVPHENLAPYLNNGIKSISWGSIDIKKLYRVMN